MPAAAVGRVASLGLKATNVAAYAQLALDLSDWIMPLVFGAIFYVLATFRSRDIAPRKPPDKFSRALRSYGTVWAVGEGYLMLGIRSLMDGTALYSDSGAIVTVASLLWVGVVIATNDFNDPKNVPVIWRTTGLAFMSDTVHPAREFDHRVLLHWISLRHIEADLGNVRIFQR